MEVKFTDLDIIDANIAFSREYLTKARTITDRERLLKLLILANKSISNAINQLENDVHTKTKPVQMKSKK